MFRDSGHKAVFNLSDTSTLMKIVAEQSKELLASADLERALKRCGVVGRFHAGSVLFDAGDKNRGIFLLCKGLVCLQVPEAGHLNRTFPPGSVLGLPSTFVGRPYSLTAVCVTDCTVAHVGKRKFLDLMTQHPVLCQEATGILSREMAFILSALGK